MARTVHIVSKAEEVMAALDPEQRCAVCGVRYSEMTCETIYMFIANHPRATGRWDFISCLGHPPKGYNLSIRMHVNALPDGHEVAINHLEWLTGKRCPPSCFSTSGWVTMREWRAACR